MRKTIAVIGIFIIGYISFYRLPFTNRPVDAPPEELGRKVEVYLPNGSVMTTYENRIIKKDGKVYYKSEFNQMDITGSKIQYKEK